MFLLILFIYLFINYFNNNTVIFFFFFFFFFLYFIYKIKNLLIIIQREIDGE